MNVEIANSLSGYIETLYVINQKLIKLCGSDIIDKYEHSYKLVLDIIQDIPRVIPYKYNFDNKKLELEEKDGLLEYKNDIDYLYNEYQEILNKNYDFLDKIRVIRNKYEHKMHDVKRKSSGSGSMSYFDFEFEVSGKIISVEACEFIRLLNRMNILFSRIVKDIMIYSTKNKKEEYAYYRRLSRFDFEDFNKIYNSALLRIFGKIMLNY